MDLLDWRYTGSQRDHIELVADLDRGWKYLDKKGKKPPYWGFDNTIYLPNRSEPDFWCHLYLVATAPTNWESVHYFPGTECNCRLGCNLVSVKGSKFEVDIPLSYNSWTLTNESGRHGIYEMKDPLFSIATNDGRVGFRVQLWFVHHGPKSMFVRHEYEWGDGFALIGGRPESNRRRF